jgi:hypothetical protein
MTRRTVLVDMADQHAGHKLGLMNPAVKVHDEDENGKVMEFTPTPTAMQSFLWEFYVRSIETVKSLAGDDEILLLNGGDECNGLKYPTQLVSTRLSDQIAIAAANMEPWYALPNIKHVRLATGTGAHSFLEGSSTLLLKDFLTAKFPQFDTAALNHGLLEFNGISIDYAHHGPHPGSRDWLRGNTARFYLRDIMYAATNRNQKPPNIVLRHHYHSPVYEYLENSGFASELYVVPSLCGLSEHGIQATQSAPIMWIGFLAVVIVDGQIVERHRLYERLDLRTREVL